MSSLGSQIDIFNAARTSVSALSSAARSQIEDIFDDWDSGRYTKSSVRYQLEGVIRSAYRGASAIARNAATHNSELDGWSPDEVFNTDYLQSLLSDVRRNLRDYKAGRLSRESATLRMQLSADVAASRGMTDQLISAYSELQGFGYSIEKYWIANFDNNVPCEHCQRLHGTSVGLEESFHSPSGPNIYIDLQGPPRHPNCKCKLVILIRTLDNSLQVPDFGTSTGTSSPVSMSSAEIRKMPKGIFSAVVASIKAVVKFLRRSK